MFYCKKCEVANEWPEGFLKSYGPCEICGVHDYCNDVPSKYLPEPREENDGTEEKS